MQRSEDHSHIPLCTLTKNKRRRSFLLPPPLLSPPPPFRWERISGSFPTLIFILALTVFIKKQVSFKYKALLLEYESERFFQTKCSQHLKVVCYSFISTDYFYLLYSVYRNHKTTLLILNNVFKNLSKLSTNLHFF